MKFLVPLDLVKNEIRNARIQNLAGAPDSPVAGQVYFDTALDAIRFYSGSEWITVGDVSIETIDVIEDVDVSSVQTGDALVYDGQNWSANATVYQKVAEKGQADGFAPLGSDTKIPAQFLPDLAITQTFVVDDIQERDALTVQEGDVSIVTSTGQTFIFSGENGEGGAWVLLAVPGAAVLSVSGNGSISSTGGQNPSISLDDAGVTEQKIADEAVTEAKLASALSGKINDKTDKFAVSVGDGSETAFSVSHNFGTRDVQVGIYESADPYAQVIAEVRHASTSAVNVVFASAPTANQYRVVVTG